MKRASHLFLVLSLLAVVPGAPAGSQGDTATQLAGLSQPVEILRDRWGINHIYAQNEADLFFAQGYAAAQDRLFQFEIWRRQATGTVAEILGRRELMRDRGARLHQFRGDMDDELNRYHPRGKAIVEAYVRGVNAYIAETERNPALLPMEFRMLGIKPGRWTPAVVISRHQALTANVGEEVRLLRAIKASNIDAGARADDLPGRQSALRARSGDRSEAVARRGARVLHARSARACSSSLKMWQLNGEAASPSRARQFKATSLAQDRRPIRRDPPISTPIRATSVRTTGWSPGRERSARGRSSPTIRIA